jgi:hypothetical protein
MYLFHMKIQRVYVDTSVIGGCRDEEFAPWSNGLMRDFRQGNFKPVTSSLVSLEIAGAVEEIKTIYAGLLSLNYELLEVTDEAISLADVYIERSILTPKYYNDGLHIAIATIGEVDVLVSWNFKHIVHFDKMRMFDAASIELGYKPLQIYSPREVTNYGED